MARLNTSLLILGLILGSLAVARASRGLLDGGKGEKEDKEKCYPKVYYEKEYQKECPKGKVEDCFYTEPGYGYVTVSKKDCFNDKYSKDHYAISYTGKDGYLACTDGYTPFYAKCNSYVNLYIVDSKYYNKDGKKYVPDECKNYYYYYDGDYNYEPCSVCDYTKSFKVKCEKKEDEPKYYEDKP